MLPSYFVWCLRVRHRRCQLRRHSVLACRWRPAALGQGFICLLLVPVHTQPWNFRDYRCLNVVIIQLHSASQRNHQRVPHYLASKASVCSTLGSPPEPEATSIASTFHRRRGCTCHGPLQLVLRPHIVGLRIGSQVFQLLLAKFFVHCKAQPFSFFFLCTQSLPFAVIIAPPPGHQSAAEDHDQRPPVQQLAAGCLGSAHQQHARQAETLV